MRNARPVTRAAIEVSIDQSKGGKGAHTAPTSNENGQPPSKNEQRKEEGSTVHALAITNSETVTTSHTSNTAAVIHPERAREAAQARYNRRKGFRISTRTVRWLIVTE